MLPHDLLSKDVRLLQQCDIIDPRISSLTKAVLSHEDTIKTGFIDPDSPTHQLAIEALFTVLFKSDELEIRKHAVSFIDQYPNIIIEDLQKNNLQLPLLSFLLIRPNYDNEIGPLLINNQKPNQLGVGTLVELGRRPQTKISIMEIYQRLKEMKVYSSDLARLLVYAATALIDTPHHKQSPFSLENHIIRSWYSYVKDHTTGKRPDQPLDLAAPNVDLMIQLESKHPRCMHVLFNHYGILYPARYGFTALSQQYNAYQHHDTSPYVLIATAHDDFSNNFGSSSWIIEQLIASGVQIRAVEFGEENDSLQSSLTTVLTHHGKATEGWFRAHSFDTGNIINGYRFSNELEEQGKRVPRKGYKILSTPARRFAAQNSKVLNQVLGNAGLTLETCYSEKLATALRKSGAQFTISYPTMNRIIAHEVFWDDGQLNFVVIGIDGKKYQQSPLVSI